MILSIVQKKLVKRFKLSSFVEFIKLLFISKQLRVLQTRLKRTINMKNQNISRRDFTIIVTNISQNESISFRFIIYLRRFLNY